MFGHRRNSLTSISRAVSAFSVTGISDFEDLLGLSESDVLSKPLVTLCPGVPTVFCMGAQGRF